MVRLAKAKAAVDAFREGEVFSGDKGEEEEVDVGRLEGL